MQRAHCFAGAPPFETQDKELTWSLIMWGEVESWPEKLSKQCRTFLEVSCPSPVFTVGVKAHSMLAIYRPDPPPLHRIAVAGARLRNTSYGLCEGAAWWGLWRLHALLLGFPGFLEQHDEAWWGGIPGLCLGV